MKTLVNGRVYYSSELQERVVLLDTQYKDVPYPIAFVSPVSGHDVSEISPNRLFEVHADPCTCMDESTKFFQDHGMCEYCFFIGE